jgi:hypothetical protein
VSIFGRNDAVWGIVDGSAEHQKQIPPLRCGMTTKGLARNDNKRIGKK